MDEQKRARRKFRHEITARMKKVAMRRMKYFARDGQILAAARVLTDRYMHQVDHAPTRVEAIPEAAQIPSGEK